MLSMTAAVLTWMGVWAQPSARAADPPFASFQVNGESFAAYGDTRRLWVVSAPIQVELQRDESQLAPGCDRLESKLAVLAPEVENCKTRGPSASCNAVRMLIDNARSEPDTIGQTALAQAWRMQPGEPQAATAAIVAAAASATSIDPKQITVLRAPQRLGVPMQISLLIDPTGASWASQLFGLVDLDDPGVAYDPAGDVFVTRDRVVACGLLAGDARIVWEQAAMQDSPLEPVQLRAIYEQLGQHLRDTDSGTLAHARRVGAAIGEALRSAGLADGSLDRRIDFLLDALFEGDALEFRDSLSEPEVELLATSNATSGGLLVPWIGVSP
jgi:hypothetical protein